MTPKRAILAPLLALTLAATAAGCGGSSAPRSSSFPVPAHVQRAIARGYPQLAYLPTRLPAGVRYDSYDGVRGFEYTLWFGGSGGASKQLQFTVLAESCAGQGPPMQTFKIDGLDVSWSGLYTEQHAWRCITRGRTSLVVQATRSVSGDANPGAPITSLIRRHALALADVVASAQPVASP